MQTKIGKALILTLIGIIIMILAMYGFRNERESVELSVVGCVQSVCIESKVAGESCAVLAPRVSEIVIETDRHDSRLKNIKVIPSNDRCR